MKSYASPKSLLAVVAVQLGMLLFFVYYTFIGGQTAQGIFDDVWRRITIWLTTLLFGGWLAWQLARRQPWLYTPFDYPLLALLLAWGLATLTSINPVFSRETLYFFVSYLFFFYLTVYLARRTWLTDLLLNAVVAVSGMVWSLGFWQLSQWYQAVPPLPPDIILSQLPRLSVLGNPNTLAAYIALVMPVVLYKLTTARLRLTRILLALWLVMLLATALLSQSRGGILGLVVGVTFWGASRLAVNPGKNPTGQTEKFCWRRRGSLILLAVTVLGLAGLLGMALSRRGLDAAVQVRWQVGLGALKTLLAYPLTGVGPGALGQALLRFPLPLDTIWPDAHNLFLTVMAETGLMGAAALLWLGVVAARQGWHAVQQPDAGAGWACLAGLVGFTVHNLLDSMFKFPLIMLLVAVWGGVWVSSMGIPARRGPLGWGVAAVLLAVNTWLGLAGLSNITLYNQAVAAANHNDWPTAYRQLQQAATLAPEMPFYQRQLGLVAGFLTADNAAYRAEAITHYRAALAQVDRLAEDHANLACLLWHDGQPEAAIAEMTQARALAPHNGVYRLNLGLFLEATGQMSAAQTEYVALLAHRPELAQSAFWQARPARATIITATARQLAATGQMATLADLYLFTGAVDQAETMCLRLSESTATGALCRGKVLLAQNRWSQAAAELEAAVNSNPGDAYRLLSRAALAQNQPALAGRYAQRALFYAKSALNYYQAGLAAEAQGQLNEAVTYYESAFAALTPTSSDRLSRYASEVARRRPLPVGYLPCLRQIYPDDWLYRITQAEAAVLHRQGKQAQADAVLARLRRFEAE